MVEVIRGGSTPIFHAAPTAAGIDSLPPDHVLDTERVLVLQHAIGELVAGPAVDHEVEREPARVVRLPAATGYAQDDADAEAALEVQADRPDVRLHGPVLRRVRLARSISRSRDGDDLRLGSRCRFLRGRRFLDDLYFVSLLLARLVRDGRDGVGRG